MSFGAGRPAFAAAARPPSPNAFIISAPPAAWQFTIAAPVRAAAAAARPTVLGMSWSFRSRKTPAPERATSRPQLPHEAAREGRIAKIRGSDLDGVRHGDEVLDDVLEGPDLRDGGDRD